MSPSGRSRNDRARRPAPDCRPEVSPVVTLTSQVHTGDEVLWKGSSFPSPQVHKAQRKQTEEAGVRCCHDVHPHGHSGKGLPDGAAPVGQREVTGAPHVEHLHLQRSLQTPAWESQDSPEVQKSCSQECGLTCSVDSRVWWPLGLPAQGVRAAPTVPGRCSMLTSGSTWGSIGSQVWGPQSRRSPWAPAPVSLGALPGAQRALLLHQMRPRAHSTRAQRNIPPQKLSAPHSHAQCSVIRYSQEWAASCQGMEKWMKMGVCACVHACGYVPAHV